MKKLFVLLLMLSLFVCSVTSCLAEPKTPEELYQKMSKTMNKLNSYEMEYELYTTSLYNENVTVSEGKSIVFTKKRDFYYYNKTEISALNATAIEVYDDGVMYVMNEIGDLSQKICSDISYRDYIDYYNDKLTIESFVKACDTRTFLKNEDGTWSMLFSEYSEESKAYLYDKLSIESLYTDSTKIKDVSVKFDIDEEYRLTQIMIELKVLIGDSGNKTNSLIYKTKYSDYNNAERSANKFSKNEYIEVDDLRILHDFEDSINSALEDKKASFILDYKVENVINGERTTILETQDKVSYSIDINDNISYENDSLVDGILHKIRYSGNILYTDDKREVESQHESKAYIRSLINSCEFNSYTVSGIKKTSENSYTITCDTDKNEFFSKLSANTYDRVVKVINVTFSNGKIAKINCEVTCYLEGEADKVITSVLQFIEK